MEHIGPILLGRPPIEVEASDGTQEHLVSHHSERVLTPIEFDRDGEGGGCLERRDQPGQAGGDFVQPLVASLFRKIAQPEHRDPGALEAVDVRPAG